MALTAAEIAELKARLITLEKAYASGVLRVKHGDTETLFRSESELLKIINRLKGQIAAAEGAGRSPRYIREEDKGL